MRFKNFIIIITVLTLLLVLASCNGANNENSENSHQNTNNSINEDINHQLRDDINSSNDNIDHQDENNNNDGSTKNNKDTDNSDNFDTSQNSNTNTNLENNQNTQSNIDNEPENNSINDNEVEIENVISIMIIGKDQSLILEDKYTVSDNNKEISVLDVLKYVCEENNILLDYSGTSRSTYVKGIDNLYEFDFGSGSGWVYYVNTLSPLKPVSTYYVKSGDQIRFYYSLELGDDIDIEAKIERKKE